MATGNNNVCRVSFPQAVSKFFSHHDTQTIELVTCHSQTWTGFYTELHNIYARQKHTEECKAFNKAYYSEEPERSGDCTIV